MGDTVVTDTLDLTKVEPEVLQALHRLYQEEALEEAARTERMLAAMAHTEGTMPRRSLDGVGELVARYPTWFRGFARAQGEDLRDRDYLKFLTKRYPETAVRSKGTKEIRVGWREGAGAEDGRSKMGDGRGKAESRKQKAETRNLKPEEGGQGARAKGQGGGWRVENGAFEGVARRFRKVYPANQAGR